MFRKHLITIIGVAVVIAPCFATIIHIPAQYPTIQQGINASTDGDTILAQPITYYETIAFNGHNVVVASLFLTTGDLTYIALTVIDGGYFDPTVSFSSGEDSTASIIGFKIINGFAGGGGGIRCIDSHPKIMNNIITNNCSDCGGGICCVNSQAYIAYNIIYNNYSISPIGNPGGGICCLYGSNCTIYKNHIYDNHNQDGAGIAVVQSNPTISYNLIFDNIASDLGGGIRCDYSNPTLINNTITQNSANQGGGIYCLQSTPTIVNTIFWDNTANVGNEIIGSPIITYSDIRGGYPGEGNINRDPLFVDPEQNEFRLQENSPCIDTGDPNSPIDPDSTRTDIGALYFHQFSHIPDHSNTTIPKLTKLLFNYPNPFNPITTISYHVPTRALVKVDIYNVLGQHIATLLNQISDPGTHHLTWNATDLPSGIYFCRLKTDEYRQIQKLVLLK